MRPIRLQVQGLTSYRQPVEVDFTELDLFAVTGPTGAGKSSLVDAMTYALFGQVPRVGRSIKDLISQGEERLKVSLEFSSNGGRYRILRSTARKGQPTIQLERFDDASGEWSPEEDRADQATRHVERLLGMDYDGFVRSVLLPQGQFQQFLAGRPDERRKVLDGILRLDVYQRMQERANQQRSLHEQEANRIASLLETQFSDATPQALRDAKKRLDGLRKDAEKGQQLRESLAAAAETAAHLTQQSTRRSRAARALKESETKLSQAQSLLTSGEKELQRLNDLLKAAENALSANRYDAEGHNRLTRAHGLMQRIGQVEAQLTRLRGEAEDGQRRVGQLLALADETKAALNTATRARDVAEERLQNLRTQNVAVTLRKGLKPGDACPVCGQEVKALPEEEHAALDEAEAVLRRAREGEQATRTAAQEADRDAALVSRDVEMARKQIGELEKDAGAHRRSLAELIQQGASSLKEIETSLRQIEDSRQERERLVDEERHLRREYAEKVQAIAAAQRDVASLDATVTASVNELESAEKETATAVKTIGSAAQEGGWQEVLQALDADSDVTVLLRKRLREAEGEAAAIQQEIGTCEAEIKVIRSGIERAKELRAQETEARDTASLARDLASLLRSDRFQAFVREQALRVLADDGSRHLRTLSNDRYDFSVEAQDFLVVDRWNGDEVRSVKTLSGGETFLASLALALALAERLPGLGAEAERRALESLFIDEGFSYLDSETLDIVASALEVLGGSRDRLVGVVTHLPALAERMPARITVAKSPAGSTLSVE